MEEIALTIIILILIFLSVVGGHVVSTWVFNKIIKWSEKREKKDE